MQDSSPFFLEIRMAITTTQQVSLTNDRLLAFGSAVGSVAGYIQVTTNSTLEHEARLFRDQS